MNQLSRRFTLLAPCVAMLSIFVSDSATQAAIETRDVLKTYFETGDIPTEGVDVNGDGVVDFEFDYSATGDHSVTGSVAGNSVVVDAPGSDDAEVLAVGTRIDELELKLQANGLLGAHWPGNQGFLGLKFDIGGQTHFGFFQMGMDGPGTATPYAIHLDYAAWETTPSAEITTFTVPEPASVGLYVVGLLSLSFFRRRRILRGR